mmetsp:Transcript_17591/g.41355  ORF Transcript_17591/g.41355 Transcript_17591/m.41355 type:complete len:201 (+) Transcript_17591:179-781(+)
MLSRVAPTGLCYGRATLSCMAFDSHRQLPGFLQMGFHGGSLLLRNADDLHLGTQERSHERSHRRAECVTVDLLGNRAVLSRASEDQCSHALQHPHHAQRCRNVCVPALPAALARCWMGSSQQCRGCGRPVAAAPPLVQASAASRHLKDRRHPHQQPLWSCAGWFAFLDTPGSCSGATSLCISELLGPPLRLLVMCHWTVS